MQQLTVFYILYTRYQYPSATTDRASAVLGNNGFAHFFAQIFAQNLKFTNSMQDMCILHRMYKNQYPNAKTDRVSPEMVIFCRFTFAKGTEKSAFLHIESAQESAHALI